MQSRVERGSCKVSAAWCQPVGFMQVCFLLFHRGLPACASCTVSALSLRAASFQCGNDILQFTLPLISFLFIGPLFQSPILPPVLAAPILYCTHLRSFCLPTPHPFIYNGEALRLFSRPIVLFCIYLPTAWFNISPYFLLSLWSYRWLPLLFSAGWHHANALITTPTLLYMKHLLGFRDFFWILGP